MADVPESLNGLISELRRRRVFRATGLYAATAFVVLQVAALAVEPLRLPDWTMSLFWVLALAGLPVVLVLAWAFEATAEGIKRTQARPAASTLMPSRSMAVVGLGLFALLLIASVAVYGGRTASPQRAAASRAAEEHSIAVLPLVNLSASQENEYFADGITEDIMGKLARVPGLRVVSRTSVMRYKSSGKSVPEIASELGVRYVLEGSVRRAGDRVRITGQLIEAETDAHLWADDYDREMTDIFALQREIAEAIADALQVELSRGSRERLTAGETADPRAYEFYLRGRELHHRAETRETDEAALRAFRQAVAEDPGYALAWAGLARGYGIMAMHAHAPAWMDSAEVAARRAIQISPDLAEGYTAMGEILRLQGRYQEAMEHQRRALYLNPDDGVALAELGQSYEGLGHLDEAVLWAQRAIAAEPMIGWFHLFLAGTLMTLGELDAAERSYREGTRVEPAHARMTHGHLAEVALRRGRPAQALAHLDSLGATPIRWGVLRSTAHLALLAGDLSRAERLTSHHGPDLVLRAYLLRRVGRDEEAGDVLRQAERLLQVEGRSSPRPGTLYAAAQLHAVRDESDEAVSRLRAWAAAGGRDLWLLRRDPILESIRGDTRLQEIARGLEVRLREQRARVAGPR